MKKLLLVLAAVVLTSCSVNKKDNHVYTASTGAVSGAFLGAGAGAIYGSIVPGVTAAEGAAIGGGVGLVLGAAVSYGAVKQAENSVIDGKNTVLANNHNEINDNKMLIESYSAKVESEINLLEPTTERAHTESPGAFTEIY